MLEFIQTHTSELAGIAAAIILAAERIARLTPTNSDNKVVQVIRKIANAIGLNFPDVK